LISLLIYDDLFDTYHVEKFDNMKIARTREEIILSEFLTLNKTAIGTDAQIKKIIKEKKLKPA